MNDHIENGDCFCKQCCWEAYLRGEAETNYKLMKQENRSGGYSPQVREPGRTQEPRNTQERTRQPRLGDRPAK